MSDLVYVRAQHPIHRGPTLIGWRSGAPYPALRADLVKVDGVQYHGNVPVRVDATLMPDGTRPYSLHRGRPTMPAPTL